MSSSKRWRYANILRNYSKIKRTFLYRISLTKSQNFLSPILFRNITKMQMQSEVNGACTRVYFTLSCSEKMKMRDSDICYVILERQPRFKSEHEKTRNRKSRAPAWVRNIKEKTRLCALASCTYSLIFTRWGM